jgi:hypothetical protein
MDTIQKYWKILADINDSIKFAEAKGIAIISVSGILTAFLFSKDDLSKNLKDEIYLGIFILCILALFLSILFAILCIKPNFKNKSRDSIFFFNSILEKHPSSSNFKKHADEILENDSVFFGTIIRTDFRKIKNRKKQIRKHYHKRLLLHIIPSYPTHPIDPQLKKYVKIP